MDLELGSRQALPSDIGRISLGLQLGSYKTWVGDDAANGDDDENLNSQVAVLGGRYFFGDGWLGGFNLPVGTIVHNKPVDEPPEQVSGFGDLELGLGYDFAALWGSGGYRPSLVAELGIRLPTGEEAKTGGLVVSPTMLALGWGVFGVAPRLTLTWFLHPNLALALPLGVVTPMSSSPAGIRYGTAVRYGLSAIALPGGGWTLSGGVEGNRRSRAHSDIEAQDPNSDGTIVNSGGHWMFANLGASYRITDRATLLVRGRLPVLADVNGTQLTETFSVMSTVAWRFGEPPDPHAGHDHAPGEHDKAPAKKPAAVYKDGPGDTLHVARGGDSFEVAKVLAPGKLTVIDYWADWCAPCEVIGAMLDELVTAEPRLAVRKAEVPGLNTAIARQRLPGVQALPVVHIYGTDGRLLKTLNGTDAATVRATIQALLAP